MATIEGELYDVEVILNVQAMVVTKNKQGGVILVSGCGASAVDEDALKKRIAEDFIAENAEMIKERLDSGMVFADNFLETIMGEEEGDDDESEDEGFTEEEMEEIRKRLGIE